MTEKSAYIEDQILVMDAQDGKTEAMEALVARWQKKLWLYAYRTTSNADAAWEITQETWIAIIKGLRRLNDPAGFVTWAYRIVTNKSCDWIKRKVKKQQSLEELKERGGKESDNQNRIDKNDIDSILKKMTIELRTVLSLYYLEGFCVSDVADVLRIPKGTVKSRLFKARDEFKKLWQKYS